MSMLSRLASPAVRRWLYALGEVAGVLVFAIAAGTFFQDRVSSALFMITGAALFMIFTVVKRIDKRTDA